MLWINQCFDPLGCFSVRQRSLIEIIVHSNRVYDYVIIMKYITEFDSSQLVGMQPNMEDKKWISASKSARMFCFVIQ